MLDFLSLVMALVALIAAFKAFNQIAVLRARLEAIEAMPLQATPVQARPAQTGPVQTRPGPLPLPSQQELEQAPVVGAPGVGVGALEPVEESRG